MYEYSVDDYRMRLLCSRGDREEVTWRPSVRPQLELRRI